MSLFSDNMIAYAVKPLDYMMKVLGTNKWYSSNTCYKVNVQKSTIFLHTSNKQVVVKIIIMTFIMALKNNKVGINLAKDIQAPYPEHYKTAIKR